MNSPFVDAKQKVSGKKAAQGGFILIGGSLG
jgi:hypothetical protein